MLSCYSRTPIYDISKWSRPFCSMQQPKKQGASFIMIANVYHIVFFPASRYSRDVLYYRTQVRGGGGEGRGCSSHTAKNRGKVCCSPSSFPPMHPLRWGGRYQLCLSWINRRRRGDEGRERLLCASSSSGVTRRRWCFNPLVRCKCALKFCFMECWLIMAFYYIERSVKYAFFICALLLPIYSKINFSSLPSWHLLLRKYFRGIKEQVSWRQNNFPFDPASRPTHSTRKFLRAMYTKHSRTYARTYTILVCAVWSGLEGKKRPMATGFQNKDFRC